MELQPQTLTQELRAVIRELQKGVSALAEAETRAVQATDRADRLEWRTFLDVSGTVADRNALAKFSSADQRLEAELARIEVARIKAKIKALETEAMAISVMAKAMAVEWRS